jgi:peptidoglycan/LPS O-acetylase OafA/YrhL
MTTKQQNLRRWGSLLLLIAAAGVLFIPVWINPYAPSYNAFLMPLVIPFLFGSHKVLADKDKERWLSRGTLAFAGACVVFVCISFAVFRVTPP